jgi:hypothetical protein
MCGGVRYNTWCIHCCLDGFGVAVACHQQEYELHLYDVLPSDIYRYVNDLESWSGLPRELFVYRQSAFLFGHVINFLKQYMTSTGKSRSLKCSRHFVDSPEMWQLLCKTELIVIESLPK